MLLQNTHGRQVHVGLCVVIRQTYRILVLPEGGSLLHLEAVAAHMLRGQLQDMLQGRLPGGQALPRQAVHQVQREVVKPRLSSQVHSLDRLPVAVGAAQLFEKPVIVILDPQRSG